MDEITLSKKIAEIVKQLEEKLNSWSINKKAWALFERKGFEQLKTKYHLTESYVEAYMKNLILQNILYTEKSQSNNAFFKKMISKEQLAIYEKINANSYQVDCQKYRLAFLKIIWKVTTTIEEKEQLKKIKEEYRNYAIKVTLLPDVTPEINFYSVLDEITKNNQNKRTSEYAEDLFQDNFSSNDLANAEKLVRYFQIHKVETYNAIIRKYNEDLKGSNELKRRDEKKCFAAIQTLQKLLEAKNINKILANSNKTGLFLEFSNETAETIKSSLLALKTLNPRFYNVIIKRTGVSLQEKNNLDQSEFQVWYGALKEMKKLISISKKQKKFAKIIMKRSLTSQKENLPLIKERRNGKSTLEIAKENHQKVEEIYQIFANNLLLFGGLIPEIIKEIIENSSQGLEYLLNSYQASTLIKLIIPKDYLNRKEKLLFKENPIKHLEIQEAIKKLTKIGD